jgi:hypothetical protein
MISSYRLYLAKTEEIWISQLGFVARMPFSLLYIISLLLVSSEILQ